MLAVVFHFQKALAFQQLATEIYNDALAAVGAPIRQSEFEHQDITVATTSSLVSSVLLPAVSEKLSCISSMGAEVSHVRDLLAEAELSSSMRQMLVSVSSDFATMIETSAARGNAQRESHVAFVERPDEPPVDFTELNRLEMAALNRALASLSSLFSLVGVDFEGLIVINCRAANEVRDARGLPSLSLNEYRTRYMAGLTGQRARFFE